MYNKCPVNTNELAENLSYERLLTLRWNKVAGSDYWLLCLAPNLLIQYWRKQRPFYVLTMLGLQMTVSSSHSYCKLPNPLCQIVVCGDFIADKARFTGVFPPLDRRHVGRAVRLGGRTIYMNWGQRPGPGPPVTPERGGH